MRMQWETVMPTHEARRGAVEPEAAAEALRLKVGVGVVSAEVPIRWSLLRPLARLFRRAQQPDQLVRVVGARVHVHLSADDEGTVEVWLRLVNMTDRPLSVEALHLELFYTAGYATPIAQPLFQAPERPVPAFDAAEIHLTINLAAAGIRRTLTSMQQAQNPYSSPRLELTVGGKLAVVIPGSLAALQRTKRLRLPFHEIIKEPVLNVSCASAGTWRAG